MQETNEKYYTRSLKAVAKASTGRGKMEFQAELIS